MYTPLNLYYFIKDFHNINNISYSNNNYLKVLYKFYFIFKKFLKDTYKKEINSPLLFVTYIEMDENIKILLDSEDNYNYFNNKDLFLKKLENMKKVDITTNSVSEIFEFLLKSYYFDRKILMEQISGIYSIENWYKSKQVFKFNYDFFEELKDTNCLELIKNNKEIFNFLQYSDFYIDCSNLNFKIKNNEEVKGIFFSHYNDSKTINDDANLFSDDDDNEKYRKDDYFNYLTITEIGKDNFPLYHYFLNLSQLKLDSKDYFTSIEECFSTYNDFKYILNILYYLCSENKEIVLSKNKIPTHTIKNKKEKKDTKEIQMWDVGFRIGAAIHNYNKYVKLNESETSGTGSKKRPHVRKAHWHRYKTKDGYILKWLHPIFVNEKFADSDNMPVTFHK